MPRCLMAKKWKTYSWPNKAENSGSKIDRIFDNGDLHDSVFIDLKYSNNQNAHRSQEKRFEKHEEQEVHKHPSSNEQRQQHCQVGAIQTDDEEIDVVGGVDTTSGYLTSTTSAGQTDAQPCWSPHSPTAGTTAPSPPPLHASGALYYNGFTHEIWINQEEPPKYATLRSAAELAQPIHSPVTPPPYAEFQINEPVEQLSQYQESLECSMLQSISQPVQNSLNEIVPSSAIISNRKSLSMCFTSTGTALSLPPKKKDIYRPYSLQQKEIRTLAEEDLSAAQAILDLSASPAAPNNSIFIHTLSSSIKPLVQTNFNEDKKQKPLSSVSIPVSVLVSVSKSPNPQHHTQEKHELAAQPQPQSPATAEINSSINNAPNDSKTVAYTYEAFFVSDGRSKRRSNNTVVADKEIITSQSGRPKFTCTECGKQYATSSNLSRHKQTHRSLDSQSAKKCIHCGKAYVSMPALAMHVLTHKLAHSCGVCGKMFSRPWLLQGHLRSHTGEKPYGCAHCGKAFADRSNLRAHMQTHSADKNYECSRCHKTFALKSYLNKHLESACLKEDEIIGIENADLQQEHHHDHNHNNNNNNNININNDNNDNNNNNDNNHHYRHHHHQHHHHHHHHSNNQLQVNRGL